MNGMATALSTAITKDGQTTVTADLPMASHKHTGISNATSRDNYAALGQVQDGKISWAVAGGVADAITANYSIPTGTLVDGQQFYVRAGFANATTTPTFSPDGKTARTITKNGNQPLVIGDITGAGFEAIFRYRASDTKYELMNPANVLTSANLASGTLILPQGTTPAQTAEGSVFWDTDDNTLSVGDGATRKNMVDIESAQTITGLKKFTNFVNVAGTSGAAASVQVSEDTANGTNYVAIAAPANVTSNKVQTLQDLAGTIPLLSQIGMLQVQVTSITGNGPLTATTFTDISGLTVNITPSTTASRILVYAIVPGSSTGGYTQLQLVRGSTAIGTGAAASNRPGVGAQMLSVDNNTIINSTLMAVDSPATTSATTYKVQYKQTAGTFYINRTVSDTDTTAFGRTSAIIVVCEISA